MRRLARAAAAAAVALAALAPAAVADTVTVGDASLIPAGGTPDLIGQGIPVFQGDAGPGYVLAAPRAGTITSWSFLSGGVDPGRSFVLRVLRPAGGGAWTAAGTSAPAQVTTPALTDAVNGPFAASLPVQAGDRIALEPTDAGSTPVEPGAAGTDGIRFFPASLADGASAATDPASAADAGQVVPVQATVQTVPPRPDEPLPPAVTGPPSIRGVPSDGRTLTCDPGAWSGSPALSESWYRAQVTLLPRSGPFGPHLGFTFPVIGSGPSLALGDLAPGTTVGCTVTAVNRFGTVTADADPVRVQALPPELAPRHVARRGDSLPRITPGVGYGGLETCTAGRWLHYPARYRFDWFTDPSWTRIRGTGLRRFRGTPAGSGATLRIGVRQEYHRLVCRVTAANAAGTGTAYSNVVFVPQLAPRPTGPARIFVTHPFLGYADALDQGPARPVHAVADAQFVLDCSAPGYDRSAVALSYRWELSFPPQALPGGTDTPGRDEVIAGSKLEIGLSRPDRASTVDGRPLGYVLVTGSARCIVTATAGRASTDSVSGRLYFAGPR